MKDLLKGMGISSGITLVLAFIANYFFLPAWNIKNPAAWFFVGIFAALWIGIVYLCSYDYDENKVRTGLLLVIIAGWCVFFIILFIGSKMASSGIYQQIMSGYITEADFATDMQEENITNIALMDSDSARIYGQRSLGDLADVVSQYQVSETYSQIALNDVPMKVAPLEHSGLIKAMNNAEAGISGYVKVNPVSNKADFIEIEGSIQYSPSGVFSKDLTRRIRKTFPGVMTGNTFFEIDEEGTPYWITQVIDHEAGLFGCKVITGVIITDVTTGQGTRYAVADVPEWVDIVFDGDYICDKFDDYGLFANGFWNCFFGQKNCRIATDDFGYKVIDNDVWIYTGVTSVTSDESNIGFILVNGRTMETKYYSVVGAEEYSAKAAAEGEVQQYGYVASFPSLVNVSGQPTYIMVLKDSSGLVKKIAMVNVERYDVVAVADTQAQAVSLYKKLLSSKNVISKGNEEDSTKVNTTITSIEFVIVDGSTVVYVKTEDGVYKSEFNESLMLFDEGDEVSLSYFDTGASIEYIDSIK